MEVKPVSNQVKGTALCWACGDAKRIHGEIEGTIRVQGVDKFVCKKCYDQHRMVFQGVVTIAEANAKYRTPERPAVKPKRGALALMCWMCLEVKPESEIKGSLMAGGKNVNVCKDCASEAKRRLWDEPPPKPTFIEKFIQDNRKLSDWDLMKEVEKLLRVKQIAALQQHKYDASELWGIVRLMAEIMTRRMVNGLLGYRTQPMDWRGLVDQSETRQCPRCKGITFYEAQDGIRVCATCSDMWIPKPPTARTCRNCASTDMIKSPHGFYICQACNETHPKNEEDLPRDKEGSYCRSCGSGNFFMNAGGLTCRACGSTTPFSKPKQDKGIGNCPRCGGGVHTTTGDGLLICTSCNHTYGAETFLVDKKGVAEKKEKSKPMATGAKAPGYGKDYRDALEKGNAGAGAKRTTPSSSGAEWGHATGP